MEVKLDGLGAIGMNSVKGFVDQLKLEDLNLATKWLNRLMMFILVLMFWLTWIGMAGDGANF
jgi:hypothetical protein